MIQAECKERWLNFTDSEMACKCCGTLPPSPQFSLLLDDAQTHHTATLKALSVSSGYRCHRPPEEVKKKKPGEHSIAAMDFAVQGEDAIKHLHFFLDRGYRGIGINQKGDGRFVHINRRSQYGFWSY